ncbi:MAG: 5-bromo-4-chloroindolyl phosphate hydrolysis family protein [Treponemataceae bacterium]
MENGSKTKGASADWFLSGVLAAASFLVSYIFVDIGLVFSLLISALFFVSGLFLFRLKKPEIVEQENSLATSLQEGKAKLTEIEKFRKLVGDRPTVAKVDAICGIVEKILAEIKRDPGDLKEARQFLTYYLDATINILKKYVQLSSQNVKDANIRLSLERTESMLDTIRSAFEKQLTRLLSNDVMDLDTELSLLEKTIKMEGLGE